MAALSIRYFSILRYLFNAIDLFILSFWCEQVSHNVKAGDKVNCTISELQPLKAEAENIALNIVYEDEHVLVVNKPAHMVNLSI
jgi:23S rRNA-/tRNA-specific pseudouridylate synthase